MTYTTMPNSEILVAGKQHNMLVINVARGIVVKKVLILRLQEYRFLINLFDMHRWNLKVLLW